MPKNLHEEGYIGVDPNAPRRAYDKPLAAEGGPEKDLEERAQAHEAAMKETTVNPATGHSFVAPHPTENDLNPADPFIEKQRAALDKQAGGSGGRSKPSGTAKRSPLERDAGTTTGSTEG